MATNAASLTERMSVLATRKAQLDSEIQERLGRLQRAAESWIHPFLETLVDVIPDGVALTDMETMRIFAANEAFVTLVSGGVGQVIGRSPFDFVDEHLHEFVGELMKQERTSPVKIPIRRLDGKSIDAIISAKTIRYNGTGRVRVTWLAPATRVCPLYTVCPMSEGQLDVTGTRPSTD